MKTCMKKAGRELLSVACIAAVLVACGCSQKPKPPTTAPGAKNRAMVAVVDVDNGSDDTWMLVVDGAIHSTNGPKQVARMEMRPGSHEFVVLKGNVEVDRIRTDLTAGKATVINPLGLTSYFIYTESYSTTPMVGYGAGVAPDRVHSQKVVQADFGLFEAAPNSIQVKSKGAFVPFQNATRTKVAKMPPLVMSTADAMAMIVAAPNVYDAETEDYERAAAVLAAQPQSDAVCAALLKAVELGRGGSQVCESLEKYKAMIPIATYEAWLTDPKDHRMAPEGARLLVALGRMDVLDKCLDKCTENQVHGILNAIRNVPDSPAKRTLLKKALGRHSQQVDYTVMSMVTERDFNLDADMITALENHINALPDGTEKHSHKSTMRTRLARKICAGAAGYQKEWVRGRLQEYARSTDERSLAMDAVRAMTELDLGQTLAQVFSGMDEDVRKFAVICEGEQAAKRKKFTSGANALFTVATTDKSAEVRVHAARSLATLYGHNPDSMIISLIEKTVMRENDKDTRKELQRWLDYANRR